MKKIEADELATQINQNTESSAEVVRILPEHIDPIKPNDNGWDVVVTVE